MDFQDNFPIIVGVGQHVEHWAGVDVSNAPHPAEIVQKSIALALEDTSASGAAQAVDCAAFVRTFPDSMPLPFHPFGKIENFPQAVIAKSDINPNTVIYSSAGGEQPQVLVSKLAEKLHAGDIQLAVIAGGEVIGALKTAIKKGLTLDWADQTIGETEDEGAKTDFISSYEISNGLGLPPQTYAAMEQALRARLGLSNAEYRTYISQMLSRFSKVAEANPYAQFPAFRSAVFLAAPSKENYPIFEPYLKWHMAQDAVNQSAALVLTTAGKARELAIPTEKWIYLHGYAQAEDALVSKRPDLSKSQAIEAVIDRALESSGLIGDDITQRDIYSCFPIVVHLAADHLGLDPLADDLTVTGGLPFFGGAGNNYSTHAIASMVENLRADQGAFGMILANGGFMSKEAAGVYSSQAPAKWVPVSSDDLQADIDGRADIAMIAENCTARIEGYCIKHGRSGPESGYVIARNEAGRVIANIKAGDVAVLESFLAVDDAVGREISIVHRGGRNFLETPIA